MSQCKYLTPRCGWTQQIKSIGKKKVGNHSRRKKTHVLLNQILLCNFISYVNTANVPLFHFVTHTTHCCQYWQVTQRVKEWQNLWKHMLYSKIGKQWRSRVVHHIGVLLRSACHIEDSKRKSTHWTGIVQLIRWTVNGCTRRAEDKWQQRKAVMRDRKEAAYCVKVCVW